MKKIKEIMNPAPKCCMQNDTLHTVARMMLQNNIGSVAVLGEHNTVIGIITDRDLTLAFAREEKRPLASLTVKDAMTREVITCTPEDNLETALKLMRSNKIGRLPVVDGGQKLKGFAPIPFSIEFKEIGRPVLIVI